MSRVGKVPVEIPSGVTVNVADGTVSVQGPKGSLNYTWAMGVDVKVSENQVVVEKISDLPQARANYGTTRAIIANMVKGVTDGWTKALEMNGVGFGAQVNGNTLVLSTDFSHKTELEIPAGITCKAQKTNINIEGCDKEVVGGFASKIIGTWPTEPYLGKGIKEAGAYVRRKAGKTGK